ncbi:HpcH/HpaI aldolase/citrate lyase family protein [Neotabrizicola sp. VNH66]|uniref:HpcH/HpaI aldolase/citrate lyase family protein n=1 Tax=Neotabrizicola sp. VNH66 TaxID=3400918 RepID=UPI003C0ECE85
MVTAAATIRAPLFVPADRPDRFAKAAASGADAVILDLEDAVAAGAKDAARAQVQARFTGLPVLLRINPAGTPWHAADLAAARAGGFAAVILPKAEDAATVAAVAAALDDMPVIALVETGLGLAQARAVAAAGVARLAFGSVDFCADLGCAHLREVLLPARVELVLASRLAGIAPPLDGVTVEIADAAPAAADAAHARALGMTGKLCIHPRQVAAVRREFLPTEAEVDWARRVLASGDGAVAVDGAMVDEPVRLRARGILAAAG